MSFLIYFVIIMAVPLVVQLWLKKTYNKYSQINVESGMTGARAARTVLDAEGLSNVKIEKVDGKLTDHYDPVANVVRLSSDNYHGTTIAAVAVSVHEVGHAVQKSEKYVPLQVRHSLVPVASFGSNASFILILLGMGLTIMSMTGLGKMMLLLGIIAMAAAVLFQIVTLPVEFNASSRAKEYLYKYNIVNRKEESGVSSVLTAAALTYVASTVIAVAELLRFILMFTNMNSED